MAFPRRTSNFRSRSRRPQRKLIWARHASLVTLAPGGLLALAPLQELETTYGAQLIGATIMRVRGVISATIAGTSDGDAFSAFRIGMRVTDHADNAPQDYAIGAMYTFQAHADWFLFEPFMLDNSGASVAGEEVDTTAASEIRLVDVKARRKIQELDQTVEMVIGSPSPTGPITLPKASVNTRVRWDFSILVALP